MSVKPATPSNQGVALQTCELEDFENGNLIPNLDTVEPSDGGEITRTMNGDRDVANIAFDGGFLSITADFTVKVGFEVPVKGSLITDSKGRKWYITERTVKGLSTGGRPMMVSLTLEFHPALSVAEGGTDGGYFPGSKASLELEIEVGDDGVSSGTSVYLAAPNSINSLTALLYIDDLEVDDPEEFVDNIVASFPKNPYVSLSAQGSRLTVTALKPGEALNGHFFIVSVPGVLKMSGSLAGGTDE